MDSSRVRVRMTEEDAASNHILTEDGWQAALLNCHFSGLDGVVWDAPGEPEHQSSFMVSTAISKEIQKTPDVLVISEEGDCGVSVTDLLEHLTSLHTNFEVTSFSQAQPAGKVCIVLTELTKSVFNDPSTEQFETIKEIFLVCSTNSFYLLIFYYFFLSRRRCEGRFCLYWLITELRLWS